MEKIPIRIQRSRQHKQVSPNGLPVVYVGRGSKWGNPFRLVRISGKWMIKTDGSEKCSRILTTHAHLTYDTKEEAAKDAVRCYGWWLLPESDSMMDFYELIGKVDDMIATLKGKNLSCWCKIIDEPCHADLLLKLANKGE